LPVTHTLDYAVIKEPGNRLRDFPRKPLDPSDPPDRTDLSSTFNLELVNLEPASPAVSGGNWWAYLELNQRPRPYQGRALTKLSYTPGQEPWPCDPQPRPLNTRFSAEGGGAEGSRTPDPLLAKQML
jgi:hypothetical protein